jgi:hypothetical protein
MARDYILRWSAEQLEDAGWTGMEIWTTTLTINIFMNELF